LNERFEQYINGKRENLHSNFTLRLKKNLVGSSKYAYFSSLDYRTHHGSQSAIDIFHYEELKAK
jgi:hypothetical protein